MTGFEPATAARSDAWSQFDSEKQSRKVYFSERAEAIQRSPAAGAKHKHYERVMVLLLYEIDLY